MSTIEEKLAEAKQLEARARTLYQEAHEQRMAEGRERPLAERLRYAATSRCLCGAGLAYDPFGESGGVRGYWDCSAILLGTAIPAGSPGAAAHTERLPFAFYEIRSEDQPSARGATTRPASKE